MPVNGHIGEPVPSPGEILRDETTTRRFASGAETTGPGKGGFGSVVTVTAAAPSASTAERPASFIGGAA